KKSAGNGQEIDRSEVQVFQCGKPGCFDDHKQRDANEGQHPTRKSHYETGVQCCMPPMPDCGGRECNQAEDHQGHTDIGIRGEEPLANAMADLLLDYWCAARLGTFPYRFHLNGALSQTKVERRSSP